MTEKRFKFYSEVGFIDTKQCGGDTMTFSEVVVELNKLNEENEQLRKDATTLIYANQDYRHENEQLKQKLKEHESTLKGQSNSIYQLKKKNELKESIDRIDSLIHTQEDYLAWSIIYETLTGGKPLDYRLKM